MLKNGKAIGKMGVSNEMFKYAGTKRIPNIISIIFELLISENLMPSKMNMGKLIVLVKDKNGDLASVDNIRPITISDAIAVTFENFIIKTFKKIPYQSKEKKIKISS